MVAFNIKYDEPTINLVREKLNGETKEVTAQWLVETLYAINKAGLMTVELSQWECSHSNNYFTGSPDKQILFDIYSYTYAKVAKQLMRLLVIEFNITRFNFTGCSDNSRGDNAIAFDRWLEETPYPKKITLVGNFKQSRPISSSLQPCLQVVDVEGKFVLIYPHSKEIELPEKCILKDIYVQRDQFDNEELEHYKDVEEYRNRESRISRLAKQKSVRDIVKKANSTGVLAFTDNYGIPLEIGCLVAYTQYSCRLGKVVGQTSKKIKVLPITHWTHNDSTHSVLPHELVRIM